MAAGESTNKNIFNFNIEDEMSEVEKGKCFKTGEAYDPDERLMGPLVDEMWWQEWPALDALLSQHAQYFRYVLEHVVDTPEESLEYLS
jgi:hypothetical protein